MPESFIGDLDLRLAMYRRLAGLATPEELEGFAAELIDRFGKLPPETEQLLQLVAIKQLCRKANVAKLDAGPKGIVLAFHENRFARPERLVRLIAESKGQMKVRPGPQGGGPARDQEPGRAAEDGPEADGRAGAARRLMPLQRRSIARTPAGGRDWSSVRPQAMMRSMRTLARGAPTWPHSIPLATRPPPISSGTQSPIAGTPGGRYSTVRSGL